MTPGGAIAPVPVCTRADSGPAYGGRPAPARPVEPPPDAYVAVAWHPDAADVWATWNERSEAAAKRVVLEACGRVMGGGCTIAVNGVNISVAIARSEGSQLHWSKAATPEAARAQMIDHCAQKTLKCEVLHVFAGVPPRKDSILSQFGQVFNPNRVYLPDSSVPRVTRAQHASASVPAVRPASSPAGSPPAQTVKLRTMLTGANTCLDILNDGQNNRVVMAACDGVSGQAWRLERIGDDRYKLRTVFTGDDRCLDIVNDGANDKLTMADCGNYSGQMWRMTSSQRDGHVRFLTDFTGAHKCLDIVNDGRSNQLRMANCGDSAGQHWTVK